MTPAELLDDHARRPRNVGKLLNASAVGDVGSIVVGDALRFYIAVDGGRITASKFQTFNCADQVAPSSVVTELAAGLALADAKRLAHAEVCAHLGGLDFTALPARLWAVEGLRAAIVAYEGGELDHDHELDPLLCRCFGVAEETARQAIAVGGCASPDDLVAATGAGSGCGSCRADMPRLIDEALKRETPAAEAKKPIGDGPVGRIQTLLRIQRLVENRFMTAIRAAGSDLELWDFDGHLVKVRASGRLAADDAACRETLAALEQLLKSEIDKSLGVEFSAAQ